MWYKIFLTIASLIGAVIAIFGTFLLGVFSADGPQRNEKTILTIIYIIIGLVIIGWLYIVYRIWWNK